MRYRSPGSWRSLLFAAVLLAGPGSLARAGDEPSIDKLGTKIDHLLFKDAAGQTLAPADLKDKKAVVVILLSFDCPVSAGYAQPLADLSREYGPRGVAFFGVEADDEDAAAVARHAQEFNLPFPVFPDSHHAAADALKAAVTPEAFVLDPNQVLRYRGRIDDSYYARLKKNPQVSRHDLRQALDDLLAGKPVGVPATKAVGCPILRERGPEEATGQVTYYRDVVPVLQNNCQGCHRPGEVGPFSLMTYKQAVRWAGDIKDYTQARKMPPWKPVEGPAFQGERKMSDKDIATLAAWVDGGTPAGDPKEAPPPRQFVEGWEKGKPDLVLEVGSEFQVGASGNDVFRCFVLPTDLPEDKSITAFELRPGNRRVVHHSLMFLDTTGQARKLEQAEKERKQDPESQDIGPGYSSAMGIGFVPQAGMGGWAPGQMARVLPEGTGYYLPKGADIVMQVHYHRDGRVEKDRTVLGLYFAKKPVTRRFQAMTIPGKFTSIPAGDDHYRVQGSIWVHQDCTLYTVMPHMHMLGREIKVTMVPPEGSARTLVAIKDWEYNWQETYLFKEAIPVKAGTRFDIEAFYDNSAKNPSNPYQPPRRVFLGEQTTNEMCFGFLGATSDQPGRIRFDRKGPAPSLKETAKSAETK